MIQRTPRKSASALSDSNHDGFNRYALSKSYFEPLLGILLLIPALPLIGLLVVIVRLASRGPGIFKQVRVGQNGRTFTMYKIRTMKLDAESGLGSVWSQKDDPRVTPVGRIIRNVHLDEFPQLWNVVKGEMSLVGPRPERPDIAEVLAESIEGYDSRHRVKPGITGLAQLNLPADSDLDSVRRKLHVDLEYIRAAGYLLDLRIVLATAFRLFSYEGACQLFRLQWAVPAHWNHQDGVANGSASKKSNDSDGFVEFEKVIDNHAQNAGEAPNRPTGKHADFGRGAIAGRDHVSDPSKRPRGLRKKRRRRRNHVVVSDSSISLDGI